MSPYIIAIDFDDCIAKNAWNNIEDGRLVKETLVKMREQLKKMPHTEFILWTCRTGDKLEEAKKFIKTFSLPIYYFNEQHPSIKHWFSDFNSRKIFANEYWDDRAVQVGNNSIGEGLRRMGYSE